MSVYPDKICHKLTPAVVMVPDLVTSFIRCLWPETRITVQREGWIRRWYLLLGLTSRSMPLAKNSGRFLIALT